MFESKMTCRHFVKVFEVASPLSVTETLSIYEIKLEWNGKACIVTDSDTFERIQIIDPENLDTQY